MYTPYIKRASRTVSIAFEGKTLEVPEGISVAAAILGHAGEADLRVSPVGGEKRAPFCFMGVCHECLVEIDGRPNQQACATPVREGMRVRKQLFREGV